MVRALCNDRLAAATSAASDAAAIPIAAVATVTKAADAPPSKY